MIRVPSTTLWLGNSQDARDSPALAKFGIRAVVDLAAEELPAQLPRDLTYCRFPICDGPGNDRDSLQHCVQLVVSFLKSETPIVLACSAGLSRSPTIAAYALANFNDSSPVQVLSQLRTLKALDIHPYLWQEVAAAVTSTGSTNNA